MEQLCVLMVVVVTQVMYARETCIKPGKSKHSLQVVPTATPVLKPCGNYVRLPVGGLVKVTYKELFAVRWDFCSYTHPINVFRKTVMKQAQKSSGQTLQPSQRGMGQARLL